jgi:hypothetical protein
MTKEYLTEKVKESESMADFLRKIGKKPFSGNYQTYWRRIRLHEVDTSHWRGREIAAEKLANFNDKRKISLEKILVKGSTYRSNLKKRLMEEGLLEGICFIPGCPTRSIKEWCGKEITYQLDHIDGDRYNNELSNLRILCAICHTQTDTYGGRNRGAIKKEKNLCYCGKEINKKSKKCRSCSGKSRKPQVIWPEVSKLLLLINRLGSVNAAANYLGNSFNGLKKHLKKQGMYEKIKKRVNNGRVV